VSEVYFAVFEVGEVGGCEDLLPEGFKFGAGTIGVESGGDGVGNAVKDERFAELEPVGKVVSNFLMGGHDVLWVKWYFYGIGCRGLRRGRKSVGF
jgi:hypothetical protein